MTTLAQNKVRKFENGQTEIFNDLAMIAADIIYEGAAVGDNASGYSRPLVAADPFWGFAVKKKDNSAGAAGAEKVRVKEQGFIVLSVTGVTGVTDKDAPVYASDDDTFTLTASGSSSIGKVHRWVSGTTCVVYFQSVSMRSI